MHIQLADSNQANLIQLFAYYPRYLPDATSHSASQFGWG
jgi:hypothetical protein